MWKDPLPSQHSSDHFDFNLKLLNKNSQKLSIILILILN